jgi:thiol-disulfide isomerase/thioredoxin
VFAQPAAPAKTTQKPAAKPGTPAKAAANDMAHPFPNRRKSPSLDGGIEWINCGGPISMQQLRGKLVILDFWTYCCINCIHVLPTLKKIEQKYPNSVVVIGVHSAKFDGEQDSDNIREAVMRYEIEHPVINDAERKLWDKFYVSSWPSIRVIDPEGNLIAGHSGEIDFATLDEFVQKALAFYSEQGVVDETPLRFELEAFRADTTPLRFPGKVLADEAGNRLIITDSNHNRIVITSLDGKLLDIIGTGEIGSGNGAYSAATFDHPQGMALNGETLYVCDTESHKLRKVDLKNKTVTTIAGTGEQGGGWPGIEAVQQGGPPPKRWVGKPQETKLNSPWALWVHGDDLFIAMAGPHQIWKMPLDESEIGPYAGNGREDIVDGPLLPAQPFEQGYSAFAQPSGLASDGTWLYVADSEGSSIRAVPLDGKGKVKTIIGTAELPSARLFTFGDVDGEGKAVRLQHALGVVFVDGKLYVADTYNNKIKVVDVDKKSSTTIAGDGKTGNGDEPAQFNEPAGLSYAAGKLYVADTNNHSIRTIDLQNDNRVATLVIEGLAPPERKKPETTKPKFADATPLTLDAVTVKPQAGAITFAVKLALPGGYKMNELAPLRYTVDVVGDAGPIDIDKLQAAFNVEKPTDQFEVSVPVTDETGSASLRLAVGYYYCQDGFEGICKAGSVAWTMPITLAPDGKATVPLNHNVE